MAFPLYSQHSGAVAGFVAAEAPRDRGAEAMGLDTAEATPPGVAAAEDLGLCERIALRWPVLLDDARQCRGTRLSSCGVAVWEAEEYRMAVSR